MTDTPSPPYVEEQKHRIDRELLEFLNELRVVLPGVQVLFGFLLAMPFQGAFERVSFLERRLYFLCFLLSCAACAFLIAPSMYHRLHWRRDVRDKEQMLSTFNLLAIIGGSLLGLAMVATVFLIAELLFGFLPAAATAAAGALVFFGLWYALPLLRKNRERAAP
jgi:Family of unknown function (DUF6328)